MNKKLLFILLLAFDGSLYASDNPDYMDTEEVTDLDEENEELVAAFNFDDKRVYSFSKHSTRQSQASGQQRQRRTSNCRNQSAPPRFIESATTKTEKRMNTKKRSVSLSERPPKERQSRKFSIDSGIGRGRSTVLKTPFATIAEEEDVFYMES